MFPYVVRHAIIFIARIEKQERERFSFLFILADGSSLLAYIEVCEPGNRPDCVLSTDFKESIVRKGMHVVHIVCSERQGCYDCPWNNKAKENLREWFDNLTGKCITLDLDNIKNLISTLFH